MGDHSYVPITSHSAFSDSLWSLHFDIRSGQSFYKRSELASPVMQSVPIGYCFFGQRETGLW